MLDFIEQKEQFEVIHSKFKQHFNNVLHKSSDNFTKDFNIIYGFEYEIFFEEYFFNSLRELTVKFNEESFYFYTVDPSPTKYFYHHFKKYNAFQISKYATDEEYLDILMRDPYDSPADAIALNSSTMTMFADSGLWASIAFRSESVALIGFKNTDVRDMFFSTETIEVNNFILLRDI